MFRQEVLLTWLVFLTIAFSASEETGPLVTTRNGAIRGSVEKSFSGKEYHAFHGIPFAQPPVGELRFSPPEPALPWSPSVFDATSDGSPCLQIPILLDKVIGAEDCLWLSVFAPDTSTGTGTGIGTGTDKAPSHLRPVLVWIHGGRYVVGSGRTDMYSPIYMMDHEDLVVVSIQYRLGAFGFLSTDDEVAPGNYGLLDQVLALEWIQENIASFGGDPKQVTISGHSAGSASVHGHILSPLSKGLFARAISLSGSAVNFFAHRLTAHTTVTEEQAKLFDCPTDSSQELIACLRKVDAQDLAESQSQLHKYFPRTPAVTPITTFTPRIDSESPNPFMPRDPRDMVREGDFQLDIPWMTGLTSQEGAWYMGAIFGSQEYLDTLEQDRMDALENLMGSGEFSIEERRKLYSFYFNDEPFNEEKQRIPASNFISDFLFNYEKLHAVHLHCRKTETPVYFYRFDYRGEWSVPHLYNPREVDHGGVAHLDDIRYFMRIGPQPNKTSEELVVVERFTGYIAHFARHGTPTATATPTGEETAGGAWEPFRAGRGQYMVIDRPEDSGMRTELPFPRKRMQFMQEFFRSEEDVFVDYTNEEEAGNEDRKDEL